MEQSMINLGDQVTVFMHLEIRGHFQYSGATVSEIAEYGITIVTTEGTVILVPWRRIIEVRLEKQAGE